MSVKQALLFLLLISAGTAAAANKDHLPIPAPGKRAVVTSADVPTSVRQIAHWQDDAAGTAENGTAETLPEEILLQMEPQPDPWLSGSDTQSRIVYGDAEPWCVSCGTACCVCEPQPLFTFDAWVAQGFTANFDSPADNSNRPQTFNDRANEYQLNQVYLSLGRDVNSRAGVVDLGGRVDLLYGTDHFFTTSSGLEDHLDGTPRWNSEDGPRAGGNGSLYGLSMPQLYGELFAPVGTGITARLGHFESIMGAESLQAPSNFFYSHSYAFQYAQPITNTGVLLNTLVDPRVEIIGGMTNGWDGFDNTNGKFAYLGGVALRTPDGRRNLRFTIHSGNEDPAGANNRTSYNVLLDHVLGDGLRHIISHDLGVEEFAQLNDGAQLDTAMWYGITNYLIYALSSTAEVGMRMEWFRDQNNARVLGIPLAQLTDGGNYFGLTFGARLRNRGGNLIVRPEFRVDWANVSANQLNVAGVYDDFSDKNQITAAVDVILLRR